MGVGTDLGEGEGWLLIEANEGEGVRARVEMIESMVVEEGEGWKREKRRGYWWKKEETWGGSLKGFLYTIFPSRMRMIIMREWDMVKTVTEKKFFPTMAKVQRIFSPMWVLSSSNLT